MHSENTGNRRSAQDRSKQCTHDGENASDMPNITYTIVLTKGTHLISQTAAETVLRALQENRRTVEIELDPFGGVAADRRTVVAVRHVIALTENVPAIADESSVVAIGRRRNGTRA